MTVLLPLLALLAPPAARAAPALLGGELRALPERGLVPLGLADSRAAASSLVVRLASWEDGAGEPLGQVDGALGVDLPLAEWTGGPGLAVQLGLLAGAFMGFREDGALTWRFRTFDGRFGLPLDLRRGPVFARLAWEHRSAHFADGVRYDETLPEDRGTYSREQVGLRVGWAEPWGWVGVGGRYLLHDAREAPPWGVQIGGEAAAPWRWGPLVALDVQAAQEDGWSPRVAGSLAAARSRGGRRLRAGIAAAAGPEDTGQLQGAREAWVGLLVALDPVR